MRQFKLVFTCMCLLAMYLFTVGVVQAEQQCEIVDFEQFTHADAITSFSLFGGDITINVDAFRNIPGGAVETTAYNTNYSLDQGECANLLDDTHNDTQIPDSMGLISPPGICAECDGIIAQVPDVDFCDDGDDSQGGVITFSGFSSEFAWEIPSYAAIDPDDGDQDILLRVGTERTEVGSSDCDNNPNCGNGNVVTVITDDHVFTEVAEFVLEGSGGIDNIEICRSTEVPGTGRFTGGGHQIRVDGVRVTRGLTIHCDLLLSNNLEVNWQGNSFHMTEHLKTVECSDDPDIIQFPPAAPLDTLVGVGTGRYNGMDGFTIEFTLVDAGEPGVNDKAALRIYETGNLGNVVLELPLQSLDGGNLQAHFDQPHS